MSLARPSPFQPPHGLLVELESFAIRTPSIKNKCQEAVVSTTTDWRLLSRNLFIRKQILQFDRCLHSNRLEPVSCPQMQQDNRRTNLVRVEYSQCLANFGIPFAEQSRSLICQRMFSPSNSPTPPTPSNSNTISPAMKSARATLLDNRPAQSR